jgi:hypothetical protein
MPHITKEAKVETLKTEPKTVGDLCWLFANWALLKYNENPKWSTIHMIRRALRNVYHNDETSIMVMNYAKNFERPDIDTAADLAFFQFNEWVVNPHEEVKALENGNCFEGAKIPCPSAPTVKAKVK